MKKFRLIVFLCGVFFLFMHLSFTLIYNFEKITENPTIRFVVFKYMFPFFNQNNKVFAPDPPFNKQELWVKYHIKNKGWTAFQNPQSEMLEQHIGNRFSPIANRIKHYDYVLRHVYDAHIYADYYLHNGKDSLAVSDSIKNSYLQKYDGYNMAQRFFSEQVAQTHINTFDSLQLQIRYIYPERYAAKPLQEITSSKLVIGFPSLPILRSNAE